MLASWDVLLQHTMSALTLRGYSVTEMRYEVSPRNDKHFFVGNFCVEYIFADCTLRTRFETL